MTSQTTNLELQKSVLKRWLTPTELETEYGFSQSWQAKARMVNNSSTLPFSKIGKLIRYDRVAINNWLKINAVQGTN